MIAVDTNVIVRLLTGDDEQQYQAAYTLFQMEDIFISKTVVLEVEWVLRFAYEFARGDVASALQRLFGLENVALENARQVAIALEWHTQGLDFADALHLASAQGADQFATFDRHFRTGAEHLSPIPVSLPE